MTSYDSVFKSFLKRIEDIDLPRMTEEDQNAFMTDLLDTAIFNVEMNDLMPELNLQDRNYDECCFTADLQPRQIEVLAIYMVAAWYEPKINSLEHTCMIMGVSGEKWTDQREHLEMLRTTRSQLMREARHLCRNISIRNNSYLNG